MATYEQALPALTTSLFRSKRASGASNAIAFSTMSYPLEPPSLAWLQPTVQSFMDLLQMPPNWDGYGASQTRPQILHQAFVLLADIMESDAPPPNVVPLSDGGVQVEWHRHGHNLEIEFPADEPPTFYYYQDHSETECEGHVSRNFNQIQRYIAGLK